MQSTERYRGIGTGSCPRRRRPALSTPRRRSTRPGGSRGPPGPGRPAARGACGRCRRTCSRRDSRSRSSRAGRVRPRSRDSTRMAADYGACGRPAQFVGRAGGRRTSSNHRPPVPAGPSGHWPGGGDSPEAGHPPRDVRPAVEQDEDHRDEERAQERQHQPGPFRGRFPRARGRILIIRRFAAMSSMTPLHREPLLGDASRAKRPTSFRTPPPTGRRARRDNSSVPARSPRASNPSRARSSRATGRLTRPEARHARPAPGRRALSSRSSNPVRCTAVIFVNPLIRWAGPNARERAIRWGHDPDKRSSRGARRGCGHGADCIEAPKCVFLRGRPADARAAARCWLVVPGQGLV
jgi:hypothetical protein